MTKGDFQKNVKEWLKSMFCGQNDILDGQEEVRKARMEIKKGLEKIDKRMNYRIQTLGEILGKEYESPVEVE